MRGACHQTVQLRGSFTLLYCQRCYNHISKHIIPFSFLRMQIFNLRIPSTFLQNTVYETMPHIAQAGLKLLSLPHISLCDKVPLYIQVGLELLESSDPTSVLSAVGRMHYTCLHFWPLSL